MGIDAFNKLLVLLEPSIAPSPKNKKDDALDAKTILMMTLRYLAGASYIDILRIHGIAKSTTFSHINCASQGYWLSKMA
jgi:predicted aldo/keto reductase-like oxidoreductase